VLGETVLEECRLGRIRKKVALVRQAGVVEALFDCVLGSVGRELDYTAWGSNSGNGTKEGNRG